jgi:hypothetical protein
MLRVLPAAILLFAAIVFHRQVLFDPAVVIPWDLRGHHLPLAAAYADALQEGVWPLWEPYGYCGRPLLANPQTAVFYPGVFLAAWGGREGLLYRLEVLEVVHVFLAGLFTYLLARRMGLGRWASLAAGLIFELGGFLSSQVQHLSSICGAPWFVLAWLSLLLPKRWTVPALSLALTLHFFLGFTGYTVMVGASTFLLAVILWAFRRAEVWLLVRVAAGGFLAAMLAAIQLWPSLELVRHSVGQYRTEWLKSGGGLPPEALLSMVYPRAGNEGHDPTLMYLYASLGGLVLVVLALARRRDWTLPLAVSAGVCGLLMMGEATPVGALAFAALPAFVRNTVYWYLFMAPFLLALALLAGHGADAWLRRPRWQVAACAVIALDLIAAGSGRPMNTQRLADEPMMGEAAVDGSAETYARLREATGPYRFDTGQESMALVTGAPLMRLRTGNGYDPLALERVIQARLAFARGERWGAFYVVEDFASPVVNLMSIRALTSRAPISEERLRGTGLRETATLPGRTLYVNAGALPRYRLVGRVREVRDLAGSAAALRQRTFDPAVEAVAEGFGLMDGTGGKVRVIEESRQKVVVETEAAGRSFLVTSEAHYPGWEAQVDGQPVEVKYTNAAFRGVAVPAGRHVVKLEFGAPTLASGGWISGAGLLMWMAVVLFSNKKAGI